MEAETKKRNVPGAGAEPVPTPAREAVTENLIRTVEHNPELKALLEQAIFQARQANPDPETNPVWDLGSYYDFLDRCLRCMPWEICPSGAYVSLYDRIDQGMGCLYFICDQPLAALEEKPYFHNSLIYHEPFRSWFIRFLSASGAWLSTEESWNEAYYRNALANPAFHLDDGTYESPENWKSFNDFFARRLKDPARRPIAAPEDETLVISPADAVPQGLWEIDDTGRVLGTDVSERAGIAIKTGRLRDVSALLQGSRYAQAFRGGRMSHTLLDVNDYHRYHAPVSGTVREVLRIPQGGAPGCVIVWEPEAGRYMGCCAGTYGWQSLETRGAVVLETDGGGYAAVVPVGMCQVSSVNFEPGVEPGARIKKGDPLGYFLFGGSDIVLLFSPDLRFELTAERMVHTQMGRPYGRIARS